MLRLILTVARSIGLFSLARILTASDLRILCYHGAALDDENEFRPGLFMTEATFERRMKYLSDAGFPVLHLGDALDQLKRGTLPRHATVITIDDGWYGTYRLQYPILRKYGFPATLYVSSYYLENQTQVFNVAVSYVLWKSGVQELDVALSDGDSSLAGKSQGVVGVEEFWTRINAKANALNGAEARQALLRRICDATGFSWQRMEAERLVSFMNIDEARESSKYGVDIQLHTHRHRFPDDDFQSATAEIEDNRRVLGKVASSELVHFCYPSGVYSQQSIEYLKQMGVKSATTTAPGFNDSRVSRLELTRFLDSEKISDLEFEAEMSGFFQLIRKTGYRI